MSVNALRVDALDSSMDSGAMLSCVPPNVRPVESGSRPPRTISLARSTTRGSNPPMRISELHVGMAVIHPQHGPGTVKSVAEHGAEVLFNDGRRPLDPEAAGLVPAEPQASLTALSLPLQDLIERTVDSLVDRLGLEQPDSAVRELAPRWKSGKIVLHPHDPALATKEVELEQFFHKIVLIRNNLRVLEQKINASEVLTSAEKFDWQQYLTRIYGSLTTFNILFKEKESQF